MPVPNLRDANESIGGLGTVGEFWRWAMSDMLNNRNRGILAEFIVTKLLNDELTMPRLEWDCYDIAYRSKRIEVKSSAYIQSWHKGTERSKVNFNIGVHNCWDARTNQVLNGTQRWAHIYVFCVFPAQPEDMSQDVLELDRWAFYVCATTQLETEITKHSKGIGLTTVKKVCGEAIATTQLKVRVDALIDDLGNSSA